MKKIVALFLCVVLVCLSCMAFAECTPAFYRVSDSEGHTIYLLGTIHACFPEALELPQVILDAFEKSDVLAVEIDVSGMQSAPESTEGSEDSAGDVSDAALEALGALYTEDSQREKLGDETFDELCRILSAPEEFADHLSGEYLLSMLTMKMIEDAGCSTDYGVDAFLAVKAHEAGKPVAALETVESQLAALTSGSAELTLEQIRQVVVNYEATVVQLRELATAWIHGDTETLVRLLEEDSEELEGTDVSAESEDYSDRLYSDRNTVFVQQALDYLSRGETAFIAIGAAHILAADGIVPVLREQGYTVEQLCPAP